MPDPSGTIREWFSEFTLLHLYSMVAAVFVTLVAVVALRLWLPGIVRRVAARSGATTEDGLAARLTNLLTIVAVLLGAWAVGRAMPVSAGVAAWIDSFATKGTAVLLTLAAVYVLVRIVNETTERYGTRMRDQQDPRAVYVGAVRKIANIALVMLAGLLMLSALGYKIGPLLASLGVAGIAVALAVQDTLGNLFAGLYLTFDQPIRPGDYIVLGSGEEGFVANIGWRSTKLRSWDNTLVIIPNSKLAQATITNWHLPVPERSVSVKGGVDRESDLAQVEAVCLEVAAEVMERVEGAATHWQPLMHYKEFGASNIGFVVTLRVVDPTAVQILQHEYMKALHERFRKEQIKLA